MDAVIDSAKADDASFPSASLSGYKLIIECAHLLDCGRQPIADDFQVYDGERELDVFSAYIDNIFLSDHSRIVIAIGHLYENDVLLRVNYHPESSPLQLANSDEVIGGFDKSFYLFSEITKTLVNKEVIAKVIYHHERGLSRQEISAALGLMDSTVFRLLGIYADR